MVQTNLIRTRLKLLQYLDRLQTYEVPSALAIKLHLIDNKLANSSCSNFCSMLCVQEILGGIHVAAERYEASFFRCFRSQNIVEVATDYAKVSRGAVLVYLYSELLLASANIL